MSPLRSALSVSFSRSVGQPWREAVLLRDYSSFKIGGPADYFFSAGTEGELIEAVVFAQENSIPFFIFGGGYNVLFADEGFRGLIIHNDVREISRVNICDIRISSGTELSVLTDFCILQELGGLEFLAGIPGSIGGAVYGNAGAFDRDIGSRVIAGRLLDSSGELSDVKKEYFSFAYRWSRLKKNRAVLLQVTLQSEPGDRAVIAKEIEKSLRLRKTKHPGPETACAGSYFKNPQNAGGEKIPAASLLDKIGAKQMFVGGAAVYSRHANFIINQGNATSVDVRNLAELLKQRVKDSTGIQLEEEVIFLPAVL